MGGSKENRYTPATEHWSIAVKDGKPLEKQWRQEIPIPRGGQHRYDTSIPFHLLAYFLSLVLWHMLIHLWSFEMKLYFGLSIQILPIMMIIVLSNFRTHIAFFRSYFSDRCYTNRACVVVDDKLFVIAGQEGDFMAKPGSPIFQCSRRNEVHD